MQNGVKIIFEQNRPVPPWILRETPGWGIGCKKFQGRDVHYLEIPGGEASFSAGGELQVKTPNSDTFKPVFELERTIGIYDHEGKSLQPNPLLCQECATLTGELLQSKPSDVEGRVNAVYWCTKCEHRWTLERI